jgi:hypothetical protein
MIIKRGGIIGQKMGYDIHIIEMQYIIKNYDNITKLTLFTMVQCLEWWNPKGN